MTKSTGVSKEREIVIHTISTHSCESDKNFHKIILFEDWLDTLKEFDIQLQADHTIMQSWMWLQWNSKPGLMMIVPSLNHLTKWTPLDLPLNPLTTTPKTLKLMHEEGQLLVNNDGCTKCHKTLCLPHQRQQSLKGQMELPKGNWIPTHHPSHSGCCLPCQWEQKGEKICSDHHFS